MLASSTLRVVGNSLVVVDFENLYLFIPGPYRIALLCSQENALYCYRLSLSLSSLTRYTVPKPSHMCPLLLSLLLDLLIAVRLPHLLLVSPHLVLPDS